MLFSATIESFEGEERERSSKQQDLSEKRLRLHSFSAERSVPGLFVGGTNQPGLEPDVAC
ncbi:hypothetical protein Zm00014a_023537 [Zea mays]|jgi:hypothetical protein|uniref:Uncharacterized protein n=1 Tax=Zea mays TaxID=4577 RepID=A0A3L6EZE9_MAIZE|nr:hypothetical protein Zm00014a_023537 [Zea mays]